MTLAELVATRLQLEQRRDSADPPTAALALLRRAEEAARAALRVPPLVSRPREQVA